ncbi:WecB/TagA/CpsF family glycosyltransferase [Haloferula sp.]|uniref:WecB/TagA/CpsF family glycosyltransferase n=1 Tax=Haloferula sp. TaxID=2497595 RepID=UPI0032A0FE22
MSTPAKENESRRVDFLGCPMDLLTSETFLDEAKSAIENKSESRVVQFVNANKVAKISEDKEFGDLMWRADYVLTDGLPMMPLARMLHIDVPERIDGIGLMGKLLQLANENSFSVYLLGAKQEVLEACVEKIGKDFPGVKIVGYRNGYFKREEAASIAADIAELRPDMLFLGMGSPTKEELADEFKDSCGATIIQGVGGSFDVMAGLVKRAPNWVQQIGFEWFYRVMQEPRRMFWRYATTISRCLAVFSRAFCSRHFTPVKR